MGAVVSASALAGIALVDSGTGPSITFSSFYVIPVALIAWRCPRWMALAFAFACASTWVVVDVTNERVSLSWFAYRWHLSSRLALLLSVASMLALLGRALDRERELARKDHLTGTFNSRAFYELAEREISRANRYGRPLTLVYVDVDDVTSVNDTLGHNAGDLLLQGWQASWSR